MVYWFAHLRRIVHAGSRLLEHFSYQGGETGNNLSDVDPEPGSTDHNRLRLRHSYQEEEYINPLPGGALHEPRVNPDPPEEPAFDADKSCLNGFSRREVDRYITNAGLNNEIARNTMITYGAQWRSYATWAKANDLRALPADPSHVVAYITECAEQRGHKPATLRTAVAAIAFVHRASGARNPCAAEQVKKILRSVTRKVGRTQKQAAALTEEAYERIRAVAHEPRRGLRGRMETPENANRRGAVDIGLIGLMRDAMLRVSEAAALTWDDVQAQADHSGRVYIRRSKTDAEGEGAVAFVSTNTMRSLNRIRGAAADADSVFLLGPNQISRRIKKAAIAAGLGDRFSGHSPRVGMARDLARAGIQLPRLMTAGRWRAPSMPAHYIRNETAGQGAVAQYYGHFDPLRPA